jgi:hypothetical protein
METWEEANHGSQCASLFPPRPFLRERVGVRGLSRSAFYCATFYPLALPGFLDTATS